MQKGRIEEKHADLWRMRKTTGDLDIEVPPTRLKDTLKYNGAIGRSITAQLH